LMRDLLCFNFLLFPFPWGKWRRGGRGEKRKRKEDKGRKEWAGARLLVLTLALFFDDGCADRGKKRKKGKKTIL